MSSDLHIALRDPSRQRLRALFTLGATPREVQGLQALVNRWLKTFLTPKGSHPWRRDEGTEFYRLIGGSVATLRGCEALVVEAVDDANDQVLAQDRAEPTRPAAERLQHAGLVRFVEVPPSGVEFWVALRSVAGEAAYADT